MDTIRMALECCVYPDSAKPNCERCGYSCTKAEWVKIDRKLAIDILALLKAQEPKKPYKAQGRWFKAYHCSACGKFIGEIGRDKINFCYHCGQAVKWDA